MKIAISLLALMSCMSMEGYGDMKNSEKSLASLMESRHSGRTFDPAKPVSQEQLEKIVKAARFSPSCYNDQPWSFIIANKNTDPEAYQKVFNTLVEFNQGWAKNAPVLIVSVAGSNYRKNGKPNRFGQYDTGAAAMSMMYEAAAIGLMAHQMGGFDDKAVREAFNIPEDYTPMSVMALGYEAVNAPDKDTPKERIPEKTNFFFGKWGGNEK